MKDLLTTILTGVIIICSIFQIYCFSLIHQEQKRYTQFINTVVPIIEEMDSTAYTKRCIYLQDSLNNEVKRYLDYEK